MTCRGQSRTLDGSRKTMTYRKSPQKAAARLAWDRFVRSNQPVIASTGLPDSIFSSVDHFDNFLSHGCLDHHFDPSSVRVEALNSTQYDALVILTESYFAAGTNGSRQSHFGRPTKTIWPSGSPGESRQ